MKKLIISLFFAVQAFAEEPPLIVGTTSGYAPFVSLNAQGEYEGFDIDLAELLAKKLSRRLVIKDCGSMPGLMLSLKQGKVDILIWAISITEDRMKNMEMIYYQGDQETHIPILFWKTIPEGTLTLGDLAKKSICVEAGSFQESVLSFVNGALLKYTDKVDDAILEIKYGKSLATAIDPSLVLRFTEKYPDIKVLNLPIPKEKQSFGNGICVSKDLPHLATQVKEAIQELREEGKIASLEKKWRLRE